MKSKKRQGSALLIAVAIIAVLLLAVGLFYVLNRKKTATAPNTTSTSSTTTSSTGSAVTTNAVTIKDMAFSPDNITIKVGATVTWTNDDSQVHTVTANDGSFASDSLAKGKSYSHTFNTPGTYKYRCVIHPSMTGIVTVTQ